MKNIKISPLAILLLFPIDALAYLDPATGSVIIQAVIAALAAVGYAIKIYWYKILGLFARNKKGLKENLANNKEGQQ